MKAIILTDSKEKGGMGERVRAALVHRYQTLRCNKIAETPTVSDK